MTLLLLNIVLNGARRTWLGHMQSHANTPSVPLMELTGERKCPHLTWAERENAVMGRRKTLRRSIEGLTEKLKEDNLRRMKKAKERITAPEEVKTEARDVYEEGK